MEHSQLKNIADMYAEYWERYRSTEAKETWGFHGYYVPYFCIFQNTLKMYIYVFSFLLTCSTGTGTGFSIRMFHLECLEPTQAE